MSDEPLTNAAVEWMRARYRYLSIHGAPPAPQDFRITDDFIFEDCRSRVGGVNFGNIDASGWPAFVNALFEVSSARIQFRIHRVVALRGERLAAYVEVLSDGDVETHQTLHLICMDRHLRRLERLIFFDLEDTDAATAELDRLHAEIESEGA